MRVLVVSDIHGNWPALEAVAREPHDAVICLGDIVGYGPDPAACVQWVAEHAECVVQGNHDHANAEHVPPRGRPEFGWLADAVAPVTAERLSDEERTFLGDLPHWGFQELDGRRIACVHAKPSDPLYGHLRPDSPATAREVEGLQADVLLVGHTHVPYDRAIGRRRVINPGSVGQPRDGDSRASYVVLSNGRPEFKRVPYPVDTTVAALARSGIEADAIAALGELLRTGSTPELAHAM
jgi:putative phosphoesterase